MNYRHSPFDEEILDAMIQYNKTAAEKFTLVDARILSLVHSYDFYGQTFFASNQYIADRCLTTPVTVQKSINKLCDYELILKDVSYENGKKQRVLKFNAPGAIKFKNNSS